MKIKMLAYWTATIVIAAELIWGGVLDLTRAGSVVSSLEHLGYPKAAAAVTADELARRTAAAHETALADIATATAKALRTAPTGPAIAFSATAHQAHAAVLLEGLTPAPSRAPAAALTAVALAQAQTAAAARHLAALPGVSGPLARLLASIAASDAALASTVRGVSR